jgi:hypothetical protein
LPMLWGEAQIGAGTRSKSPLNSRFDMFKVIISVALPKLNCKTPGDTTMALLPTETDEALKKSAALVRNCITEHGFIASLTDSDNYRRIWGRDGIIVGLAALMTGEPDLQEAMRRTLQTLGDHQGPHGEIPSNVDMTSGRISYGGTTGRVDADLWFVIGAGEYYHTSKDDTFLERQLPVLDRVMFLLGAWEFNNRGLLYIPATGDWSDEFIHNGYILYDQLLYLQALRSYCFLCNRFRNTPRPDLVEKISRLKALITDNYWFGPRDAPPEHVYHEVLFNKGRKAADRCTQRYWMPFFSPHGYGYRFDTFANTLASLLDVASDARRQAVDGYLEEYVVPKALNLLPAFYPVIRPVDDDWEELKITFSYNFKNHPYEYHNGGLWQMLTGFYVADQARRGRHSQAALYLEGINQANHLSMDGSAWGFPEFINGKTFCPGGNHAQCWSASAALMGHHAIAGKQVFSINEADTPLQ